jgi:hypothetical protein
MFRFTIRDLLWLMVVVLSSVVAGFVSSVGRYYEGYKHGLGENAELVNLRYNHERATACLKKHGLWPGCDEE